MDRLYVLPTEVEGSHGTPTEVEGSHGTPSELDVEMTRLKQGLFSLARTHVL